AQQLSIFKTKPETRNFYIRGIHRSSKTLPDGIVLVVAPDADERDGAGFFGPMNGSFEDCRLTHLTWREHRVKDHRFPRYVTPGEIRSSAQSDPDGLNVHLTVGRDG